RIFQFFVKSDANFLALEVTVTGYMVDCIVSKCAAIVPWHNRGGSILNGFPSHGGRMEDFPSRSLFGGAARGSSRLSFEGRSRVQNRRRRFRELRFGSQVSPSYRRYSFSL